MKKNIFSLLSEVFPPLLPFTSLTLSLLSSTYSHLSTNLSIISKTYKGHHEAEEDVLLHKKDRGQMMRSRKRRDKDWENYEDTEWRRSRKAWEKSLCNGTLPLALFLHMLHINPLVYERWRCQLQLSHGEERGKAIWEQKDVRLRFVSVT